MNNSRPQTLVAKLQQFPFESWVVVLYVVIVSAYMVTRYAHLGNDIIFILFLGAALLTKRVHQYLKDWLPFVIMLFAYDALRSIGADLWSRVHITFMINADRALFGGTLPTLWLQSHFYHGVLGPLEYLAIFFYTTHFYFIFCVAFLIWFFQHEQFRPFVRGFILLTFLGFITQVLYPAMPPWLANNYGYLQGVHRIIPELARPYLLIGQKSPLDLVNSLITLSPNLIAAMPSMHAAWPWYTFFFLFSYSPRWTWAFIIVPIGVSLSVVYLGEHYVVDVLAGIAYALAVHFFCRYYFKPAVVSPNA